MGSGGSRACRSAIAANRRSTSSMAQHLGQRAPRARARQRGAGIVGAMPFVGEKGEEPPQRRRFARDASTRDRSRQPSPSRARSPRASRRPARRPSASRRQPQDRWHRPRACSSPRPLRPPAFRESARSARGRRASRVAVTAASRPRPRPSAPSRSRPTDAQRVDDVEHRLRATRRASRSSACRPRSAPAPSPGRPSAAARSIARVQLFCAERRRAPLLCADARHRAGRARPARRANIFCFCASIR